MGFARVGSNPTVVDFFLTHKKRKNNLRTRPTKNDPRGIRRVTIAPWSHATNKKCILRGSNPRGLSPLGLKSSALTTRPRMLSGLSTLKRNLNKKVETKFKFKKKAK
jgi:hypothetical protein